MSTILKTKFDWVQRQGSVLVYCDHKRFFRDSLLFTTEKVITPHQAMKLAREASCIDLRMLYGEDKEFVKKVLLQNHVPIERIIC